jgi:hypothetical protein
MICSDSRMGRAGPISRLVYGNLLYDTTQSDIETGTKAFYCELIQSLAE